MSCSLCRLPFHPSPLSTKPRPAPAGALTDKQRSYLQWGVGMGKNIPGAVPTLEYLDNNIFGNVPGKPVLMVVMVTWESDNGTIVALHTVCATLLRHMFGAADDSKDSLTELCQIELVLGRPLGGKYAGRFRHIDYEGVGKANIDQFWISADDDGLNMFSWSAFKASGLGWMLSRPDVFPKFHPVISRSRLTEIGDAPKTTSDIFTTQSLDILHLLLPYLPNNSFVSLLSTCRLLRHHALTTFQPHARTRVLELGWAVPLEIEYARATPVAAASMAHAVNRPVDGDWLLYLSQVHRKPSMQARRRIWALASEVRHVYLTKKAFSEYEDVIGADGQRIKTKQRLELEKHMDFLMKMRAVANSKKQPPFSPSAKPFTPV
ncbi:hypothetical protein OBBRIDRAFT_145530 [Obba rivulosa]|uniref:F-box domain-containing protein n=1 Tax=Obba rivulosa TaxID=1052685 RepID=A0A8E2DRG8_9APHY|nr:hypothetical protein OBBRIDRAFT_145530 [Obba rivulosa]